jgi:hypothetical protein
MSRTNLGSPKNEKGATGTLTMRAQLTGRIATATPLRHLRHILGGEAFVAFAGPDFTAAFM